MFYYHRTFYGVVALKTVFFFKFMCGRLFIIHVWAEDVGAAFRGIYMLYIFRRSHKKCLKKETQKELRSKGMRKRLQAVVVFEAHAETSCVKFIKQTHWDYVPFEVWFIDSMLSVTISQHLCSCVYYGGRNERNCSAA